ncbi:hypothetical protein AGDE_12724 [Angomonas deanei]|uniref:Uncharacterized protein n=1 Tax=Angomonas deanei TaxID=59799 RepID=A0A7G2C4X2_9TRYP|nr:hypothetical protein AGDE_12724 [Angomonas deanei]CAD2214858.1 hypothetical protein, conserved [Angomonas deanei]|eukprot:EPY23795.1 hypothetical protein AGDE_12724 [Angomonas deanei]
MFVSGGLKLSQCIEYHPQCITSTMEKLTCSSKTITEIDIDHTLLEVLVFGKPTNRNKPVRPPPELGVSVRRLLEQAPAGENKKATSSAVNVQTAFSIVTLQLSHNRIHSLVGVLQFTNVVRLSLLGNHIRRIEDCEPLSLLQNLRYLSLEHNPVTGVLNYKHHLLRITAWPQELTMQSCRLLKLDGKLVRPNDIEDAVRNLAGEMGFIPDVFKRVQFKHFVELLEKRATTNAEMKRLGLIERTYTNVLRVDHLVRLVQMGVGSFLQAHDVLNGAHASRVCVGQALRRARRKGKADQSTEKSSSTSCPPFTRRRATSTCSRRCPTYWRPRAGTRVPWSLASWGVRKHHVKPVAVVQATPVALLNPFCVPF